MGSGGIVALIDPLIYLTKLNRVEEREVEGSGQFVFTYR